MRNTKHPAAKPHQIFRFVSGEPSRRDSTILPTIGTNLSRFTARPIHEVECVIVYDRPYRDPYRPLSRSREGDQIKMQSTNEPPGLPLVWISQIRNMPIPLPDSEMTP